MICASRLFVAFLQFSFIFLLGLVSIDSFRMSRNLYRALLSKASSRLRHTHLSAQAEHYSAPSTLEVVVCSRESISPALSSFLAERKAHLCLAPSVGQNGNANNAIVWSMHRDGVQLDCIELEDMYLGKKKYSDAETAEKWAEMLQKRATALLSPCSQPPFGDGGDLQMELNAAIAAVQRASFMSRSIQRKVLFAESNDESERTGAPTVGGKFTGSICKEDKSPVTIADFAVQAIVIDALSNAFPRDKFIAEEDAEALRTDDRIRDAVLQALNAACGGGWTPSRLFETVDKGGFEGTADRVWVLDPVDGTKGFMRGEHYCIALALLVNGRPMLSTLGCPNLSLQHVLEPPDQSSDQKVSSIDKSYRYAAAPPIRPCRDADVCEEAKALYIHPPSSGSIFYAVTNRGAFARSLAMPLAGAFEVTASLTHGPGDAITLCESVEASHGDRGVTQGVARRLGLKRDYLRLDGQCKYCVVGAGAAEGNMRLPPPGYREKIWDHAAGSHFISEAGGIVTDLKGRQLDFSEGRYLAADVTGILATSNRKVHDIILSAVLESQIEQESTGASARRGGMND